MLDSYVDGAVAASRGLRAMDSGGWIGEAADGFWSTAAHVVSEVAGGAVEATTGMAEFAFKLTPAYALINPEGYVENGVGLIKGLAYGATHPVDFAKAVLDWDTWAKSPGRAIG